MPSAMKLAASRSSASWAISGLRNFGCMWGRALPRCVLSVAPASAASATVASSAALWPIATSMPRAFAQAISAIAARLFRRQGQQQDRAG